jgi:hypothetical protein
MTCSDDMVMRGGEPIPQGPFGAHITPPRTSSCSPLHGVQIGASVRRQPTDPAVQIDRYGAPPVVGWWSGRTVERHRCRAESADVLIRQQVSAPPLVGPQHTRRRAGAGRAAVLWRTAVVGCARSPQDAGHDLDPNRVERPALAFGGLVALLGGPGDAISCSVPGGGRAGGPGAGD